MNLRKIKEWWGVEHYTYGTEIEDHINWLISRVEELDEENAKLCEETVDLGCQIIPLEAGIIVRDKKIAELKKALKEIAIWSQESQDEVVKQGLDYAIMMWRGCIAVASKALENKDE